MLSRYQNWYIQKDLCLVHSNFPTVIEAMICAFLAYYSRAAFIRINTIIRQLEKAYVVLFSKVYKRPQTFELVKNVITDKETTYEPKRNLPTISFW